SAAELAEHFTMWEYAITMCAYLMRVCPFDQPDVAATKCATLDILENGQPDPDFIEDYVGAIQTGAVEVKLAPCFLGARDLQSALAAFLGSIVPGDYFALNAFLPFTGEGRREALENIRNGVGDKCKVASCLEVGPRYLHSTGQFQKGGPNEGAFLIVSADELKDIPLDGEVASLGALAKAQAAGDLRILAERGRRCMHIHLPDNSGVTLRALSDLIMNTLEDLAKEKAIEELTPGDHIKNSAAKLRMKVRDKISE
ncbi:MAG: glucose-6-phosphate isomerase, partial [Eggerthellaceae bacterium]|nr:glucose-6-phosphate isomerase [Eggerthellaceae bacterium]